MVQSRFFDSVASHLRERVAAVLVAAFLAAGSAEAVALHRCPHHHAPLQSNAAATHAAHDGDQAPSDHEAPCQCIGDCHAGAAAPIMAPPLASVASYVATSRARNPRPSSHVPLPPSHFLPFANGPPFRR